RTKVTDDLVVTHAFECERNARVKAVREPLIGARSIEALSRESNAYEALRSTSLVTPQSAAFPARGVKLLARRSLMRPGSVFRTPDFHDVRLVGMIRDHPVKAVAAKVHQATAV